MHTLNRRNFLKGALATGVLGAAGVLGGCAAGGQGSADGGNQANAAGQADNAASTYDIAETRDVDVVVVGSGNAGMAAAVEAAELGAVTVLLEKEAILGGNGNHTYGPSGFDTKYSRAAGITYDWREAVVEDQRMFNYIPNIRYYIDMAEASSDNIDWVAEHGVPISSVVDNYKGGNPTMHYWGEDGGTIDPVHGRVGSGTVYIAGMQATAESLGVEILTNTPAVDIVMDGADVAGVVAQDSKGNYIQFNAKAVMLGTGGICGNPELMAKVGRADDVVSPYTFSPGTTGDGYTFSMKAGAFDTIGSLGFIEQPAFAEMGLAEQKAREQNLDSSYSPNRNDEHPVWNILKMGTCLWVNEEGERFADESAAKPEGGVAGWATAAIMSQKKGFAIIDKAITDMLGQDCMDLMLSANEHNTKFQADTLEDLAKAMDIDYATLQATVDRYNEMCAAGEDVDFGKYAEGLVPIGEGPYFATQLGVTPLCSIGGVRVNRQMQAADVDWNPIKGLYVIGVDSFPFYTQMYYFQLPGSAVAYELHSGLVAARHAAENLL